MPLSPRSSSWQRRAWSLASACLSFCEQRRQQPRLLLLLLLLHQEPQLQQGQARQGLRQRLRLWERQLGKQQQQRQQQKQQHQPSVVLLAA